MRYSGLFLRDFLAHVLHRSIERADGDLDHIGRGLFGCDALQGKPRRADDAGEEVVVARGDAQQFIGKARHHRQKHDAQPKARKKEQPAWARPETEQEDKNGKK